MLTKYGNCTQGESLNGMKSVQAYQRNTEKMFDFSYRSIVEWKWNPYKRQFCIDPVEDSTSLTSVHTLRSEYFQLLQ